MGVATRGHLKIEKEEIRINSDDIGTVSPVKQGAVYPNKKYKNGLRIIFTETTSKEKLKMRKGVNPNR